MEINVEKATGIKCGATNCIYNVSGERCSADQIEIENKRAKVEVDTFCKTFESK